jgi:GT2 family glycosyltransferase
LDVYVVDNASTDGSVGYVREHFPDVKIIVHSTNLGFAAGYDRALERIRSDYVVLLNNDTEILNPDWVKSLVRAAAADPKIAAVGCKMVSMGQHDRLDSVGGMGIPFWRGFVDIGREEQDEGQYDTEFEPFSFCGGAALLRKAVFEKAGGFDEKFFMYMEDVDLSWRFRLLGYGVKFAPRAKIAHFFSGSTGVKGVDAQKLFYCHRNLFRAILKNCGSSIWWALRNYLLFSLLTVVGFSVLDEPKKAAAVAKALLWNLLNLRDTYSHRLAIQSTRKRSDAEILARMYPRIRRYQPGEHAKSRRILNILFEQVPAKLVANS